MKFPSALDAERCLIESALGPNGLEAVLRQALVLGSALLPSAACAIMIVNEDDVPVCTAGPGFPAGHRPPERPATPPQAAPDTLVCRAPGAQDHLLRFEIASGGGPGGALLVHSPAPLTQGERESAAEFTRSLGLALDVARRGKACRSEKEILASIAAALPGVVYQRLVKPDGDIRYIYVSDSAYDLFGVPAGQILSNPRALFAHYSRDDRESFRNQMLEASRNLTTLDVEASIMMPDGQKKFTHAVARPARCDDGSVLWTGIILDATRIKEAEAAIAVAEARTWRSILESLSQGLLTYDAADRLVIRNGCYGRLYPTLSHAVQPGATYAEVARAEAEVACGAGLEAPDRHQQLSLRMRGHARPRQTFERQIGAEQWILVSEHREPEGGTVVLYTDISELKLRERRMNHIAHHDALTDLPNRILFRHKLEEALSCPGAAAGRVAVFCLDLDYFKNINDTLGHPTGDALLKVVARRVAGRLRRTHTAARLGGDEFAVIVPDLPSPEAAVDLAERLIASISQPVMIEGQQVLTSCSIGIALSDETNRTPDRLLKNADLALYWAKSEGRSTARFFEPELDLKAHARRTLEMDLRAAIARDEMELHFQPIIELAIDRIVAFETLVRWRHPTRGMVPPIDFIGVAEETGLMRPLGEWILRNACRVAMSWPEDILLAVNVSPAQFKDRHLADGILKILHATGLPATRLELEITESLLLTDTAAHLAILNRLKSAGIRIAMDDFGTGYSSLGNLRSFPFDKIKIDRSFVRDLDTNPDSAAIVRAVLSLGSSLGIKTIAEGVETREQMSRLRQEGCAQVQGFFYSKACPAQQVMQLISDNRMQMPAAVPEQCAS